MIEINLLPGAGKKKAARGPAFDFSSVRATFARAGDPFLLGTIAACVLALAAVGWMYWSQGKAQTTAEARLDKALTDSTHYATVLRDRVHAEARHDTVLRQLNLIRTIDGDRYIWAHILDEVSRAVPQFTWVTSITFSGTPQGATNAVALPPPPKDTGKAGKTKRLSTEIPKDPVSVRVVGRTVDIQALTRFMRELADSPFLTNVQLDQSQLGTDQGKEVTQFQLTMDYRRPDSTLIHRVPLVVSGR